MLKLKPHHIIDIIRDFGNETEFTPHPYLHHYHLIGKEITKNPEQLVQLTFEADDICSPCSHLLLNKQCDDILVNHPFSSSKQAYNEYLDKSILEFLLLKNEAIISIREYLIMLVNRIEFFDQIYPHSKEIIQLRKIAFKKGLNKAPFSLGFD